ncbi:MAG: hypothetical protein E6J73_15985 [Deltaproteobacteria bacterium]|nr:MAG: hypothetical protein E6J73_15985 [Deltaproteobacteria bacterium]
MCWASSARSVIGLIAGKTSGKTKYGLRRRRGTNHRRSADKLLSSPRADFRFRRKPRGDHDSRFLCFRVSLGSDLGNRRHQSFPASIRCRRRSSIRAIWQSCHARAHRQASCNRRRARPVAGKTTQNVEVAREILAALDVPIIGEDVEGRNGRKLIFHTDTGSAWIKRL